MTPASIPRRAEIGSFYTCRNPEKFKINWRAFYERAEVRTDAVRARWRHALDVPYGPHIQHRLDLYFPNSPTASQSFDNIVHGSRPFDSIEQASRPFDNIVQVRRPFDNIVHASQPEAHARGAPVFLFLHGGGFREGDPALYGYLAQPYLERGMVFGSLGYRLTPEAYLPETMRDVEDALAWCYANLADLGADPSSIVLAGHSAGAILAAHLAVRSDWLDDRGLPTDLLKAAILISGEYDFTNPDSHQEFFVDDARRAEASPLLAISITPPPMLVAYGSLENRPGYANDSQRLVETVRARGGQADLLILEDCDHADALHALSDAASPLFQAVSHLIPTRAQNQ